MKRRNAIRLVNCDKAECQIFLSKIVELWDAEDPTVKLRSENSFPYTRGIALYLCRLDRACIYLLAKLCWYGYRPILCYGTKIVSFESAQDLIDYFTKLNLRHVCQMERIIFPPTNEEHVDVAYGLKSDKEFRNPRELYLDENGKLLADETKEAAFKEVRKKREGRGIWHYPPVTTTIELFFENTPEDLFQTIPAPVIKRATKRSNPTLFEVEVKQPSDRNLSAITSLALQVPTLQALTVADGILHPQHVYLLKALKDRPAARGSPLQITMTCYGFQDDYFVSDDLLNIFNEKKLMRMTINLAHKSEYKLFDKVLETISKSLYIQKLQFIYKETPPTKEDWVKIEGFMKRLVKIAPTLVQPLVYVDDMFPIYLHYDLTREVMTLQARIYKIMKQMNDKTLQIIDALVGVKVLDKYKTNNPIRLLPIDV